VPLDVINQRINQAIILLLNCGKLVNNTMRAGQQGLKEVAAALKKIQTRNT